MDPPPPASSSSGDTSGPSYISSSSTRVDSTRSAATSDYGTAASSMAPSGVTSGARSKRAIRVAQASADAKLHSAFEESAAGGDKFDYHASVDASKGILQTDDAASSRGPGGGSVTAGGGVSVTAYLQKMQRGGLIQSFGCLLVVDPKTFAVLAYSENAHEMLCLLPEQQQQQQEVEAAAAASAEEGEDSGAAEGGEHAAEGEHASGHKRSHLGSALHSLSEMIRKAIHSNNQRRPKHRNSTGTGDATPPQGTSEPSSPKKSGTCTPKHSSAPTSPKKNGGGSSSTQLSPTASAGGRQSSMPNSPRERERGSSKDGVSLQRILSNRLFGRSGSGRRSQSPGPAGTVDEQKEEEAAAEPPPPPPPPPVLEFGANALKLFTSESRVTMRKAAASQDVSMMNPMLVQSAVPMGASGEHRPFYAILHRVDVGLVIDLEPIRPEDLVFTGEGALQAHRLAAKAIARLEKLPPGNLRLLCDTVATEVRALTGYDRVMVYKFHEDEHGEVLAEARREDMEPYLGLHYPATDIPQAARFLFMKNRVRIIVDCEDPNVKVVQDNTKLLQPVVLAGSTLRSVHGCHAQYMKNMGTQGSIGMAIIVNDQEQPKQVGSATMPRTERARKLWGLVVCHHESKRYVPYPLRLAGEFLMQVFSLKVNMELEMMAQEKEKNMLRTQTLLCDMLLRDAPVGIVTQYPNIMDLVKCDGAALVYGRNVWRLGAAPNEMQLLDIIDWLQANHSTASGLSTDSLVEAGYPRADDLGEAVCGMIAAQLFGSDYLFWFRSHVEKEVMWHGAKHQPGEKDDGSNMHPRASFAAFLEVVRQRSPPWDDVEIDAINSLQIILRGHLTAFSEKDMQAMAIKRMQKEMDPDAVSVAESEMSRMLDTATVPVFAVDTEGCVSGWNNKTAELLGLQFGEALGRPFVRDFVADVSKPAVEWALGMALRGQETKGIEIRLRTYHDPASRRMSGMSSGSVGMMTPGAASPALSAGGPKEVILLVNAFASRAGGDSGDMDSVVGVCFVGQDLTQQKAAEGQFTKVQGDYEAIVHSGNSLIPPIFAVDESGMCMEWNPAMERISGLRRAEALGQIVIGTLFGQCLRMKADVRTKLMIVLNRAMSGQNTERYPLTYLDRQGKLHEVFLTAQARRDPLDNERVTGVFCFLHTTSVELQAALKLQRAAEEVAEAKAKGVAYVRQEIRAPLDGVKYVRQQMEQWQLDEPKTKAVETSVRCEQHLTRVLGDDDIGSMEEGFLVLEMDEYRLEDVVDVVVSIGMYAAKRTSGLVTLQYNPPEGLEGTAPLAGDAVRLQQALAEFVETAIQFTPKGAVRFVVNIGGKGFFTDNTRLNCEFRVMHSGGSGVPLPMIQQMFGHCEKAQRTQEGLGLNIARNIIQAMGGDVQYDRNYERYEFVVRVALPYPIDRASSACTTPMARNSSATKLASVGGP